MCRSVVMTGRISSRSLDIVFPSSFVSSFIFKNPIKNNNSLPEAFRGKSLIIKLADIRVFHTPYFLTLKKLDLYIVFNAQILKKLSSVSGI